MKSQVMDSVKTLGVIGLAAAAFAASLHAADGPGLNLHLSPAGNDANPGTAAQPREAMRAAAMTNARGE